MSRRNHEEQQLQLKKSPELQVKLEAARRKNSELEDRIHELKRRIQQEDLSAQEAKRATMQHNSRLKTLTKQRYAHTCILWEATASAVMLKLRGNITLWVETSAHDFVRVSTKPPPLAARQDEACFIQIAADVSRGLLACAWSRILAKIHESEVKQCKEASSSVDEMSECFIAQIPSQQVARFVRYFDVEVLHMIDKIKELRNLRKQIPEVSRVIADYVDNQGVSASGTESGTPLTPQNPMLVLKIYVSVLRSHSVSADGLLRPLTAAAENGEVDAAQCLLLASENLLSPCKPKWSSIAVKPTVGRIAQDVVEQAVQSVAHNGTLCELVVSAVQAMRR
jgi:hypothetical protein